MSKKVKQISVNADIRQPSLLNFMSRKTSASSSPTSSQNELLVYFIYLISYT